MKKVSIKIVLIMILVSMITSVAMPLIVEAESNNPWGNDNVGKLSDDNNYLEMHPDLNCAFDTLEGNVWFGKDGRYVASNGDWDWKDGSDTSYQFKSDPDGNSSAYSQFRDNMLGLRSNDGAAAKSGNLSVKRTFGLSANAETEGEILDITFADWAGVSDIGKLDENLISVYQYRVYSPDTTGLQCYWGVDYNAADGKFYYYFIYASAIAQQKDNFYVFVGRSELLLLSVKGDDWNGYVFDVGGSKYQDQIVNRLPVIVNSVIYDNGKNIIEETIKNNSVSGYERKLSTLNSLIQHTAGQSTVSVTATGKVRITLGANDNSITLTTSELDSTERILATTSSVNFGETNFLDFGDTSGIVPSKDVSGVTGLDASVVNVYVTLVNSVAQVESSGTADQVKKYIDLLSGKYDNLANMLRTFQDLIQKRIEDHSIAQDFENAESKWFEGYSSSTAQDNAFRVVNRLMQYSIGQAMEGKSCVEDFQIGGKTLKFNGTFSEKKSDANYVYAGAYWDALNDYQKSILRVAYNKKWAAISSKVSGISPISFPGSLSLSSKFQPKNILEGTGEIDRTRELVQEYEDSGLSLTGSVLNVGRVCGVLGRYVVVSSLYTNSQELESIYAVYNANLESLAAETWSYDTIEDGFFAYLPKRIGIFGSNSSDYAGMLETDENWNRFVCMLYNVNYAFEVCVWSKAGEESGYTPQDLEKWFNSDHSGAQGVFDWLVAIDNMDSFSASTIDTIGFANDEVSINMLRSIIELYDLCDFLDIGIGDWSDAIDCYLRIYEENKPFFNLLRNSNIIFNRAARGEKSQKEPLGSFFSLSGKSMSDQWIKGFALSALYVPMETNVYDANSVLYLNDPEWVAEFFYKYGFFRKALYINTDNSAIVNEFSSGVSSGTRVAVLSDLLNYERDIILTVDDNFYNANKIDTVISRLDYTAIRNTDDAEDSGDVLDKAGNFISGMMDLDTSKILKTGADMYYSDVLASGATQLGAESTITSRVLDGYLLSAEDILGDTSTNKKSVLDDYEYSVKMSYGVVSAIYRSNTLYNECLRAIVSDNAVFKSSKSICSAPGTSSSQWRSVYNYCMLMNLDEQMKNDCASTLDLDAPIFVDIFGNILTESGLVIIPAACNATLCGTNWTPYTVGWSEYYNNGNHLTTKDFNEDVYEWLTGREFSAVAPDAPQNWTDIAKVEKKNAGGFFWISGEDVVLKTSELTSGNLTGTVQWEALNKNSTVVRNLFFNDAYYQKGSKIFSHTLTNLIVEVLRGAPIEHIDYEYEGLSGNLNISKYGVYMAYKLEELVDALVSGTNGNALGGNAVVTMPNLAFVSGVEYIVLYVFKVTFAIMVVALAVSLYMDAIKNSLGIKSVIRFLATCLGSILAITVVPNLVSWTYYDANKNLLAEPAGRLMMLNYVKEYDGSEIGITSVTTPETATELYIKVDDVSVSWWTIIPEVLFGDTPSTVTELYKNQLKDNAMALTPGVQMKGDGLYVNVQDIYDSSDMQFTPATNTLSHFVRTGDSATRVMTVPITKDNGDGTTSTEYQSTTVNIGSDNTSVVSFSLPYYVFLEQLVANINEYNLARDITAYSWSVGSNGHVLTYDILTPYLTSPEFLDEGYDILGLDRVLKLGGPRTLYNYAFTDSDIAKMERSSWYYNGLGNETFVTGKVDKVYEYARNFVIENHDILGKVPDEVFLKVMAMQCAIEYNKEFGVARGNAVEIINVDTRDLMRFMVSEHSNMYKHYSYSFARYVYEESGTIGVVFAALLVVVYWLTSFLKPVAMLLILGLLVVNVVLRKLLFRKESRCIEGYLIGCACLCLCNYLYALMLKVSMSVADFGFGAVTAMVVAFLVQVAYVVGLALIMAIEVKDWRNSGFNEFKTIGNQITSQVIHAKNVVTDKVMSRSNEAYRDSAPSRAYVSEDYDSLSVEAMLERDREREEKGSYNPT